MKIKLEKWIKRAAVGIFFAALLLNVKITLDGPYFLVGHELAAETTGTGTDTDTGTDTSSGTNTSGGGDCECKSPTWLYGVCNQRIESVPCQCVITTINRTYLNASGGVCGSAVITGGVITATTGIQTEKFNDSTSTAVFTATRVNCPTDGTGNSCEEYRPC